MNHINSDQFEQIETGIRHFLVGLNLSTMPAGFQVTLQGITFRQSLNGFEVRNSNGRGWSNYSHHALTCCIAEQIVRANPEI